MIFWPPISDSVFPFIQGQDVTKIIQDLNLDRMTEITVINTFETALDDNNNTNIQIADAVIDYLEQNNLGNVTMAAAINLMVDKQTLNILRSDIIGALT